MDAMNAYESSYQPFQDLVSKHKPSRPTRAIRRSTETFPSARARGRLEVDGAGWQRFSRQLDQEIWVSLVLDQPSEPLYIRPAFALGTPSRYAPHAEIQRKVERAVARFNRDIAKAELLARLPKPRWRDRLRKRLAR